MILIALFLGGLFLLMREGWPWLKAVQSGVIDTRSHNRERVERAAEPERFAALARRRRDAMTPGAICVAIAVIWALWLLVDAIARSAPGA